MSNCINGAKCSTVFDSDTGETVCNVCGRIIAVDNIINDEALSMETGWLQSKHHPVNPMMGDKALGSMISSSGKDSAKLKNASKMIRTDHGQIRGLTEFDKIKDKLSLPDFVIKEAMTIFNKTRKKGFIRGREINTVVGACCYLIAKQNGLNVTQKEIARKSGLNSKLLFKTYLKLCDMLNIDSTALKIPTPEMYMDRIMTNLDIPLKYKSNCVKVLKEMHDMKITTSKNPISIAAAACYVGCLDSAYFLSQKTVAYASGTTEVTLRNRANEYLRVKENDLL